LKVPIFGLIFANPGCTFPFFELVMNLFYLPMCTQPKQKTKKLKKPLEIPQIDVEVTLIMLMINN
jgi:hypothetical protein